MSNFIPNQVVSETKSLICFYHPRPDYPIHILLVPKEEIHDLLDLEPQGSEIFTRRVRHGTFAGKGIKPG